MRLFDRVVDALAAAIVRRLDPSGAREPFWVPPKGMISPAADGSLIQPFVDTIEWEPQARPLSAHVVRVGTSSGKFGTLSVCRDAEYRLSVSVVAIGIGPWTTAHSDAVPGSMHEGMEIEAEDAARRKILLPNALVSGTSTSYASRHAPTTTDVDVHANRLVRAYANGPPTLLVDWFISGPSDTLNFWRVTERERSESYTRLRRGSSPDREEHRFVAGSAPPGSGGASARDYLLLDLPTGAVRVCHVPEGNAPTWARPIGIEHEMRDIEPSEDLRDGIVEALGFMFGRHILRVGTTVLDDSGLPVREEAISPWGRDVIDMASRSDSPPTPLFDWNRGSQAEAILTPVVAAYLSARDELNLSHVVWTIWIALRMPLMFDMPLFASALEALMKGWFASKRTKTGGVYMPTKDFRTTFVDAIDGFTKSAKGLTYGDRIVRKIGRANEMGVNERFEVFFEELELPVGEGEDAVIRARNISAHGGKSSRPAHDLVMLGYGYRTLLNRVVLKVLGYTGEYIDYSVVGHPQRPIDEPIGYRSPITPK